MVVHTKVLLPSLQLFTFSVIREVSGATDAVHGHRVLKVGSREHPDADVVVVKRTNLKHRQSKERSRESCILTFSTVIARMLELSSTD